MRYSVVVTTGILAAMLCPAAANGQTREQAAMRFAASPVAPLTTLAW